jgi:hypothetical protein
MNHKRITTSIVVRSHSMSAAMSGKTRPRRGALPVLYKQMPLEGRYFSTQYCVRSVRALRALTPQGQGITKLRRPRRLLPKYEIALSQK